LVTPQEVNISPPNLSHAVKLKAKALSESSDHESGSTSNSSSASTSSSPQDQITLLEAFAIPNMINVTFAFFCLKLVRYVLVLWLPMYFSSIGYSIKVAGMLAITFEIGNTIGTACMGALIDKIFKGRKIKFVFAATACMCMILCTFVASTSATAGMKQTTYDAYLSGILMFVAGLCEPGFVITGTISADLGEYGGRNVQASLAGIINGLGGLGSVVQGPLVGLIADVWNWNGVFYIITSLCAVAAIALLPAIGVEEDMIIAKKVRLEKTLSALIKPDVEMTIVKKDRDSTTTSADEDASQTETVPHTPQAVKRTAVILEDSDKRST
jgi:sugar phosphate permease